MVTNNWIDVNYKLPRKGQIVLTYRPLAKDSDEIAEERQEIFFIKNGRMPLREYDC